MEIPEMNHVVNDEPGIYIIRCKATNATYTGSSLTLRRRLQSHVYQLRAGNNGAKLLQRDWNRFGEDEFEFLACHKPAKELLEWEELITLLADSLDDFGGYNKMLGQWVWSLSSRIKNTEVKLTKKRKFSPLPALCGNPRLSRSYLRTFCQGSTPFFKSEPLLTTEVDQTEKRLQLQQHLAEYLRFDLKKPDDLRCAPSDPLR